MSSLGEHGFHNLSGNCQYLEETSYLSLPALPYLRPVQDGGQLGAAQGDRSAVTSLHDVYDLAMTLAPEMPAVRLRAVNAAGACCRARRIPR